jgi:ubiquinone/menaquinone biosynthesis C-methylase UbiE
MMDTPESSSFQLVAPYYDTIMRDVPYKEWMRYLVRLLKYREHRGKRVLDLACGTGSVSELLAASGIDVVGVDLSEGMIEAAKRKAARKKLGIEYHVQDAAHLDLPGPPFDLCVSLFDSLNYILSPEQLQEAMNRVFAHLSPRGLFIFDINSAFALENSFFDQDNLESTDKLRYVWRSSYDPNTRLCTVAMRFFHRQRNGIDGEFREMHVQFAYREEELMEMLKVAGFERIETFHAYSMHPVHSTTDRIFFIAQKPTNDDNGR